MTKINLSEWALTHQPMVLYLIVILMAAGFFSYQSLGRAEDPNFTFKVMVVRTAWRKGQEFLITLMLEALLPKQAAYVGVIGSRRKAERFRQRLRAADFTEAQVERLRRQLAELREKSELLEVSAKNASPQIGRSSPDKARSALSPQKSMDLANNFILGQVEVIWR